MIIDSLPLTIYVRGVFVSHSSRSYVWDGKKRTVEYDLISVGDTVVEVRYPPDIPFDNSHALGDEILYSVRVGHGKGGIFYILLSDFSAVDS